MYTQCPDCATAFRVTADVLKQASGKVRCGGCGNAFDALAYLAESKPDEPPREDSEGALPELTPEPSFEDPDAPAPPSMSAEQSAALLKTLDDLAGSDIRIEDTGVEWRLLPDEGDEFDDDDPSAAFAATQTQIETELSPDSSVSQVDEFLDDDPTPVDEFLTATPNQIEATEVFDNTESTPDDELRFDDDTGLPEDFEDLGSAASVSQHELEPVPEFIEPAEHTETQVDIVFGEPDEWSELLTEVDSQEGNVGAPVNLSEAIIAPQSAEDRDAATGLTFAEELDALPDDDEDEIEEVAVQQPVEREQLPDIDTQFDLQAEALGLDLSGVRNTSDIAEATAEAPAESLSIEQDFDDTEHAGDEVTVVQNTDDDAVLAGEEVTVVQNTDDDFDPSDTFTPIGEDTSIDNDLYAAAFEAEQAADAAEASARNLALSMNDDAFADGGDKEPADEAADFPDSTGELELELAKVQELSEKILDVIGETADIDEDGDSIDAADEMLLEELDDASDASSDEQLLDDELIDEELIDEELIDEQLIDKELLDEELLNKELLDDDSPDEPLIGELAVDAAVDVSDDIAIDELVADEAAADDEHPEIVVPPESEEEQTINRMIDQDLLRLAIEDDEGVASTMVLQGKGATNGDPSKSADDSISGEIAALADADDSSVETIIMEGEFVRTALEQEALEQEAAEARKDDVTDDDVQSFLESAKKTFRGQLSAVNKSPRISRGLMIGGLAILALLLAGQYVHQSRAELATIPAIGNVITPVYRAIGAPITPEWDVTGWRFEVTRGSTDGGPLTSDATPDDAAATVDGENVDSDVTETSGSIDDATADSETDSEPVPSGPEILTIYSRLGNQSSQPLPYPLITVSLTDRFEETIGSKVLEPGEYLAANTDVDSLVAPGGTFDAAIAIESTSADATGFKLNVCYRQISGGLRCAIEDFK